jgi:predicted dehydrogenase
MCTSVNKLSLRFLVIGCGSIGKRHIKNLAALNIEDIFAFDVLEDRRLEAKTELGIEIVDSLEEGWEHKPHVVLITTSTQMHVPLALQAVEHGCHLFVEKPLSHTLEGIERLLAEVDRRELVTMVGCNMRFHPGPAIVKRLLEEQSIGEVIAARLHAGSYLPFWRPWQDYRQSYSASPEWGGAILDCIHEIDLTLWYLGPAKVLAAAHLPAQTIDLETDGVAEIILYHESGVLSNIHLNFVQRDYYRTCQIIGSEGTIYWDFRDRQVRVYGADGELRQTHPEPNGWQLNQMYLDEMEHFIGAIKNGSLPMNPTSEAVDTLKVALAARRMEGQAHS